jgi:Flp pilus assembly protein CpaB
VTTDDPRTSDAAPTHTIRPWRGLPGGRAAVGGLLVTAAVLAVWFLAGGGDRPAGQHYLTAARPLAAGHRIESADLRTIELDLPAGQRASTFADPSDLVGAVTRGPIGTGELVQAGSVGPAGDDEHRAQLSFSVESDWAVAGHLEVGDRIDLYATGDGDTTTRVLANATVQAISSPDGDRLGSAGTQTITVSGPDADALGRAVAATRTATLTVVRVTDDRPSDLPATGPVAPANGQVASDERPSTTAGD